MTGYVQLSCMSSCDGTPNGNTLVQFCDPTLTPDECAASGRKCQPSSSLTGYYRCQ